MTRDRFLDAMSQAAATVSVATTDGPAGRAGMTVSSLCSLSADPPSILVCAHYKSRAVAAILENRRFCVNVLRQDQSHLSDIFAGRVPVADKFACAEWDSLTTGSPVLEGALAVFDCDLAQHTLWGTHYVLIGEVRDVACLGVGGPLIYANRAYGAPVALAELNA